MSKLIGYARMSTRAQDADRKQTDLLAGGVCRYDLYIDPGVSGARASRPEFEGAIAALPAGDTLVITTLDRLGHSTANMLELADRLRDLGVGLKVLNLGGDAVDTFTSIGSMLFIAMAALARMELDIKRERMTTPSASAKPPDSTSAGDARSPPAAGSRRPASSSTLANPPPTSAALDISRATL